MHAKTVHDLARELHHSLVQYIEAAYHIRNPALLAQRRRLLEQIGVIHQVPYIECTPKYKAGDGFCEINGLSRAVVDLLIELSRPHSGQEKLLHDPPYTHQAEAIRHTLVGGRNLVVMTGTGSGKTESFLLPILGRLAMEASGPNKSFAKSGVRAMILYPMNALVNDQLGRVRRIVGDSRLTSLFKKWAGRPVRFARYTSRTPYAGVRSRRKDDRSLKQIRTFYIRALLESNDPDPKTRDAAEKLVRSLRLHGRWPAKPDLLAWYGKDDAHWERNKKWVRAVTLPDDSELITRDEVQRSAPDLLVTNYSMLEYMLMRPIERSIFDQTKAWLDDNPDEKFLIVLDEAHLYRGSAGAEVALLIRRLRDRLMIPWQRMQIICATASFGNAASAKVFASQLTGAPPESFETITGELKDSAAARTGTEEEAMQLASVDMSQFFNSVGVNRAHAIREFLNHLQAGATEASVERTLHRALESFGPLSLLINKTMRNALPLDVIGPMVFPDVSREVADRAVSALAALAANARLAPEEASLLPCRVHSFFRGLPGLWVCMDPQCSAIVPELRGVAGKLFSQPTDLCDCNARVLELYSCRYCGTAYARAYTDKPHDPLHTWSEPGARVVADSRISEPLIAIDMLLEPRRYEDLADLATYDLVTGQVNPAVTSSRTRDVYLTKSSSSSRTAGDADQDDQESDALIDLQIGRFSRCPCCRQQGRTKGSSTIQDHETKGDQPFQTLVSRQLQTQPPGPQEESSFAPLRGRKVLVFSDSRQVAARLAPNLQMFSVRDALRPLIAFGWRRLAEVSVLAPKLRLDDIFAAVVIAAQHLGVRLRPELRDREVFNVFERVGLLIKAGAFLSDDQVAVIVQDIRSDDVPPMSLLADIVSTLRDPSIGLEALAVASLAERQDRRPLFCALPHLVGVTETDEDKLGVVRAWIREWRHTGFQIRGGERWFNDHPNRNIRFTDRTAAFAKFIRRLPATARSVFKSAWLPVLLRELTISPNRKYTLDGSKLALQLEGCWARCADCTSVFRPMRLLPVCPDCDSRLISSLDPAADDVFLKRKGYYRSNVDAVLGVVPQAPMSLVAAEHTAQLNSSQGEEIFSKAEVNELLFQDIELPIVPGEPSMYAIDVLSSTTTMEVGIDIGQLSGAALRNMPPSRANYQQRSGRAGRRANAIASVVAFGGADTHDEHFFSQPAEMITGPVQDPTLSLENDDIARRHVRAFLLQCYLQENVPPVTSDRNANLFSVLGEVDDFLRSNLPPNRKNLEEWLRANRLRLQERAALWLPTELAAADRQSILTQMIDDCLQAIDHALSSHTSSEGKLTPVDDDNERTDNEVQAEVDDPTPSGGIHKKLLLDTLLYQGVLPRYAFPTDVTTFHVFRPSDSTRLRPVFEFAPSQGTAIALTQYAPGKLIWIAGRCYRSGAIYSPVPRDRSRRWDERQLYRECRICGFAERLALNSAASGDGVIDCRACGSSESVGPPHPWFIPSGFAHPGDEEPIVSPDEIPETSYATRAKLIMESSPALAWRKLSERLSFVALRTFLLVSNTGPDQQGYRYCSSCGRIEAMTVTPATFQTSHVEPFPDRNGHQACRGRGTHLSVVLGTDFRTDIALFSLRVHEPVLLHPQHSSTHVALRTLCEALAFSASELLGIEHGEVMAEYRPALSPEGRVGREAEIFLYDTLPGGAGFSRDAAERREELLHNAYQRMSSCRNPDCDFSCYRCMRNYRNRLDHSMIDRHTGAALAHYLLKGTLPPLSQRRLSKSATLLHDDLGRQLGAQAVRLNHDCSLGVRHNGREAVIVVTHPLLQIGAPRRVGPEGVLTIEISELLVRQNLASASAEFLDVLQNQQS